MTVNTTLSVLVKTPISGQPATIEILKADGSNWPTFADRFLGFLTADQLEALLEIKSYKILVDAEYEVVTLEQQEEMTDAQFKKLIEVDSDVKFVADAIFWNGPAMAERKKCMAHNAYKATSCIRTIIKVVLPSAVASELLPIFSNATCVADAWALLRARFDKRSAQAHLANVKGLFTKPMSGSGAAAVREHIADLQRRFDVIRRHERAKSSAHLRTTFADSFVVLALLASLPPEYSPTVLSLGERYEEMSLVELQTILEGAADQLMGTSGSETQALVVMKRKDPNACYNCGKVGHYARICPHRDHQRKGGAENANWRKKKDANVAAKNTEDRAMVHLSVDEYERLIASACGADAAGVVFGAAEFDGFAHYPIVALCPENVRLERQSHQGMATRPSTYPHVIHVDASNYEEPDPHHVRARVQMPLSARARLAQSPKVDSAAGAHFCGDKSLFATLEDMHPGEGFLVSLGDHRVCRPVGKGTMRIRTPSGNIVHLDPVWYIPGFKTLVSVSELYDQTAVRVLFGERDVQFVHRETGDLLAKGVRHGDTWIVPGVCEKGPTKDVRVLEIWGKRPVGAHVADAVKKVSLAELWHARLFHVGHDRVSAVCTLEHGIKDDVGAAKPAHECMTCLVANARNRPHPVRHLRANRLFGVLHADLASMKTVGMGGINYFATVTDEYSRWCFVLLLRTKDDFGPQFLDLLKHAESYFGVAAGRLHSDHGGEFVGNDLRSTLLARRMHLSTTSPGSPESNGLAERTQGVLKAMMRAAMTAAKAPDSLWPECVRAACYVRNRVPSDSLNGHSPFQVVFGVPPDMSKCKVWGSLGGAVVPSTQARLGMSKFAAGVAVRMVGYGDELPWVTRDGYRVWDGKKVFITRDVKFAERLCVAESRVVARATRALPSARIEVGSPVQVDLGSPVAPQVVGDGHGFDRHVEEEGAGDACHDQERVLPDADPIAVLPLAEPALELDVPQAAWEPELPQVVDQPVPVVAGVGEPEDRVGMPERVLEGVVAQEPAAAPPTGRQSRRLRGLQPEMARRFDPDSAPRVRRTPDVGEVEPEPQRGVERAADAVDKPQPFDSDRDDCTDALAVLVRSLAGPGVDSGSPLTGIVDLDLPTMFLRANPDSDLAKFIESASTVLACVASAQVGAKGAVWEPKTVEEALAHPDWRAPTFDEYNSLVENGTWVLVDRRPGDKVMRSGWIFKWKLGAEGKPVRAKSRLVAKGYTAIPGVHYTDTFAPVASFDTLRLILALAAHLKVRPLQLDIKTAFLYGYIKERVLMEQPPGFVDPENTNKVCLLVKALYGTKQAPRMWFCRLADYLISLGFTESKYDKCLFMYKTGKGVVFIGVYVDDLPIVASTKELRMWIVDKLKAEFKVHDLGDAAWLLGCKITYGDNGTIYLDQSQYVKSMGERFQIPDKMRPVIPMRPSDFKDLLDLPKAVDPLVKSEYLAIVGSLLFAATKTRPDIAAATAILGRFMHAPGTLHLEAAKRLVGYLLGTPNLGIKFLGKDMKIDAFADADWAEDRGDRKSTSGFVVRVGGTPVAWRSKKQTLVAKSTMAAEYVSASLAGDTILTMRALLEELGYKQDGPTPLMEDNESAERVAKDALLSSKHVEIHAHWLQDQVAKKTIALQRVDTENQIADILTKPLAAPAFRKLRDMIGIVEVPALRA